MSDALSEMLAALHLSGAVFFRGEFTAPYAVDLASPGALAEYLFPGEDHRRVVAFHIVEEGSLLLLTDGSSPVRLEAGDLILVADDLHHVISDDVGRQVSPGRALMEQYGPGPEPVEHGGGGPMARLICGYLSTTRRGFEPLLDALPPMITIRAHNEDVDSSWLTANLEYTLREASQDRPGSHTITARLSELLFVEVLRAHLQTLDDDARGWLAALRDPGIGRALNALHAQPARKWTVEALAGVAGQSRSAFSSRFTELLDMPPMQYLTRWRCRLAAEWLLESEASVAEIAARVGYASEASFNRAFKREMGAPPVTWAASA